MTFYRPFSYLRTLSFFTSTSRVISLFSSPTLHFSAVSVPRSYFASRHACILSVLDRPSLRHPPFVRHFLFSLSPLPVFLPFCFFPPGPRSKSCRSALVSVLLFSGLALPPFCPPPPPPFFSSSFPSSFPLSSFFLSPFLPLVPLFLPSLFLFLYVGSSPPPLVLFFCCPPLAPPLYSTPYPPSLPFSPEFIIPSQRVFLIAQILRLAPNSFPFLNFFSRKL